MNLVVHREKKNSLLSALPVNMISELIIVTDLESGVRMKINSSCYWSFTLCNHSLDYSWHHHLAMKSHCRQTHSTTCSALSFSSNSLSLTNQFYCGESWPCDNQDFANRLLGYANNWLLLPPTLLYQDADKWKMKGYWARFSCGMWPDAYFMHSFNSFSMTTPISKHPGKKLIVGAHTVYLHTS